MEASKISNNQRTNIPQKISKHTKLVLKEEKIMAIRYKVVGRNMTFRNQGSFGLKSLANKRVKEIRKLRKEAGVPYKSIKVKKFDASKYGGK